MALANVGCLLATARRGRRLPPSIDSDLEAPGLHKLLSRPSRAGRGREKRAQPGLIEFLSELDGEIGSAGERLRARTRREPPWEVSHSIAIPVPTALPSLRLLRRDIDKKLLPPRITTFDSADSYRRSPWLMRTLAEALDERYASVLVDSPATGLADASGVCAMLLPDKLVVVFPPGRRACSDWRAYVSKAIEYRRQSDDLGKLVVFPAPESRIDVAEEEFKRLWRTATHRWTSRATSRSSSESCGRCMGWKAVHLDLYFDDVQLQVRLELCVRRADSRHGRRRGPLTFA